MRILLGKILKILKESIAANKEGLLVLTPR